MPGVTVLLDRVYVNIATTGQGTVTVGAAVANNFATPAEAGVANGDPVTYLLEEGDDFELGRGVYSTTGPTITRATVALSKIGGTAGTTKMTLAGAATLRVVASAADMNVTWQASAPTGAAITPFWVDTDDDAVYGYLNGTGYIRLGQRFADGDAVLDTNGNELLEFLKTASAVNHPKITNAATGNAPSITAAGSDTNIDLKLDGKGTGGLIIGGATGKGQGTLNAENGLYDKGYRVGQVLIAQGDISGSPANIDVLLPSAYTIFRAVYSNLVCTNTTTSEGLNLQIGYGNLATPNIQSTGSFYSYLSNYYWFTGENTPSHSYDGQKHYSQVYCYPDTVIPYSTANAANYSATYDWWLYGVATSHYVNFVGTGVSAWTYYALQNRHTGWARIGVGNRANVLRAFGYNGINLKSGSYKIYGVIGG